MHLEHDHDCGHTHDHPHTHEPEHAHDHSHTAAPRDELIALMRYIICRSCCVNSCFFLVINPSVQYETKWVSERSI